MKRQARIVLAILLMTFVVFVGQSSAQEMGRYIVTIEGHPGPAEQAVLRAGGAVDHVYDIISAIAVRIPEQALQGFSRNPFVLSIEPDIKVYAVDTELDDSWGVKRIGAGTVHDSLNKGAGVKVAILDTGIDYNHDDLDANYKGGYDFVNEDADPIDDDGHGTHCAGIVAAEDNGFGVVGVAPEAELYALKVLGSDGSGNYSDVIAALDWAVLNGIKVTNNSYGSSGDPGEAVKTAFDNAAAAGVLNVCAAGNNGNPQGRGDNVIYPARYESCIAVTATDDSDSRARFSSTGPDVELSAPGVDITSTYLGGGYATGSGTSMAAPHVAGVAALAIASVDVRGTLVATAEDLGDPGWDPKYGYGLVDADEATGVSEPPPNNAPTVSITSPADGSTFDSVANILFEGTASDTEDGDLTAGLAWTSSIDGPIGTGGSFSAILSDGTHTITASVTDSGSKTGTDLISITVGTPPSGAMYVATIEMSLSTRTAGRNTFTKALATVTIVDGEGSPVGGATVSGFWIDATSDIDSGVTDSSGKVTLESDAVKNAPGGTTFTFIVDDVVKSGWYWIYDDKTGSITVE